MHAPLGLSLAFHLAALGLPMWLPAAPPPPPAPMQVRMVLVAEPKPVVEPPRPVVQPAARPAVPAAQPLLAGGGAMSEEADEASVQAVPAAVRANLADAGSGGGAAMTAQTAGSVWSEPVGGAQRGDVAQAGPGPARMREAIDSRSVSTTATSSGAQAGTFEQGSLRGGDRVVAAVLARQAAGPVVARPAVAGPGSGTPALAGGEAGAAARAGVSTAPAQLRSAGTDAAGAVAAGASVRSSGVDQGETQRLTRAHAQVGAARMADAGAAGRQPASAVPGLPGAVASADTAAQRNNGPERRPAGLAGIEGGRALDPSALAGAPSNLVFRAALAGDGESCFGYSTSLRRAGLQGLVVLRVRVDDAGRPQRIEIRRSSGVARLDAHARDQAERCARFVVHNRKGQPVAATLDLPVRYRFHED